MQINSISLLRLIFAAVLILWGAQAAAYTG